MKYRNFDGVPVSEVGLGCWQIGGDQWGDVPDGEALDVLRASVAAGVTFLDTGNVFPEGSGVSVRNLVGSTGVGIRLVTPFALFRVDYGRTIWNRPVEDSGLWVFGIGQTF